MGKGIGRRRLPLSLGGPEFIIAIADEAFEELAEPVRAQTPFVGTSPVVVVRASELADPHTEADLYVGRYRPATADCVKVLEYASGGRIDQFEQDMVTGAVYRGGRMVWPSAPVACASLAGGSVITVGSDAALLFMKGVQLRVTTIPTVLLVAGSLISANPAQGSQRLLAGSTLHGRAWRTPGPHRRTRAFGNVRRRRSFFCSNFICPPMRCRDQR